MFLYNFLGLEDEGKGWRPRTGGQLLEISQLSKAGSSPDSGHWTIKLLFHIVFSRASFFGGNFPESVFLLQFRDLVSSEPPK